MKRLKMKEKCTKLEVLYTFSNDEELKKHLEECADCREEMETMDKVSSLIREVKPFYLQKRRKLREIKAACAIFLVVLSGTLFGIFGLNSNVLDTIKYGQTLSAEDYGFPVDSYGLIMVGE